MRGFFTLRVQNDSEGVQNDGKEEGILHAMRSE